MYIYTYNVCVSLTPTDNRYYDSSYEPNYVQHQIRETWYRAEGKISGRYRRNTENQTAIRAGNEGSLIQKMRGGGVRCGTYENKRSSEPGREKGVKCLQGVTKCQLCCSVWVFRHG